MSKDYGFTIAELKRREKETGLGFTDQMNPDRLNDALGRVATEISRQFGVVGHVPLEDDEQASFVVWCRLHEDEYPGLDAMYSIPNGGYRAKRTGATLKQTGLLSGVPDICIPVGLIGYHHLYIEMKRRDPKLSVISKKQSAIIERLRELGNYVAVCYGAKEAIDVIKRYYGGEL